MKTNTRYMISVFMAVALPVPALRAADACCPEHEPAKLVADACCAAEAAAPVPSAFAPPPAAPRSGELTKAEATFLAGYEKIRAALAADDFKAAKAAAKDFKGAGDIASAESIADARVAFKALSAKAISMAKGRAGFYVAHCPMVKDGGGDWLTTKKAIENPYWGSAMFACGYIKE